MTAPKNNFFTRKALVISMSFIASALLFYVAMQPRVITSLAQEFVHDANARATALILCAFEAPDFSSSSMCMSALDAEYQVRELLAAQAANSSGLPK